MQRESLQTTGISSSLHGIFASTARKCRVELRSRSSALLRNIVSEFVRLGQCLVSLVELVDALRALFNVKLLFRSLLLGRGASLGSMTGFAVSCRIFSFLLVITSPLRRTAQTFTHTYNTHTQTSVKCQHIAHELFFSGISRMTSTCQSQTVAR